MKRKAKGPGIKRIAGLIEKKLGFTNGWAVTNIRYAKLCHELAEEILRLFHKERRKP